MFDVGQRVLVRNSLENEKRYGGVAFRHEMSLYKGKVVTIRNVHRLSKALPFERAADAVFEIEDNGEGNLWSEEMFELLP